MMPPRMTSTTLDASRKRKRPEDRKRSEEKAASPKLSKSVDAKADAHASDDEETKDEAADEPPHEYRGRCLYQSRKCENERALKRNGKAHNLCEEHRNKQNQHQRKFDLKKHSRTDSGDDADKASTGDRLSEDSTAATDQPVETKRRTVEAIAKQQREAEPTRAPQKYRRTTHLRRPPPLQPLAPSESTAPPTPSTGRVQSPPATFTLPMRPAESSYTMSELRVASLLLPTPVPQEQSLHAFYPSVQTPLAVQTHQLSLAPRSRSFDSGLTRISPVGGASFPLTASQTRQFTAPPAIACSGKLPSLRELPLGGKLNQRSPPPVPDREYFYYPDDRRSPPYAMQQPPPVYPGYVVDPRTGAPSPPSVYPGHTYDGYYPQPPPPPPYS